MSAILSAWMLVVYLHVQGSPVQVPGFDTEEACAEAAVRMQSHHFNTETGKLDPEKNWTGVLCVPEPDDMN